MQKLPYMDLKNSVYVPIWIDKTKYGPVYEPFRTMLICKNIVPLQLQQPVETLARKVLGILEISWKRINGRKKPAGRPKATWLSVTLCNINSLSEVDLPATL